MATYVTSDLHFNHEAISRFCDRPWPNVWDMNEALIERWNDAVGERDTVMVLGDFAFANKRAHAPADIFHRLKGIKHLVTGNHDEHNKIVLALPWESVKLIGKYRNTIVQQPERAIKQRAVLCHYPLETWDGAGKGTIMLHGHSHGNMRRVIPHRYDVGVDVVPPFSDVKTYAPVLIDLYFADAELRQFEPQDHHG